MEDLRDLFRRAPTVAQEVLALLREFESRPELLETLNDHGFGDNQTAAYSVSKVLKYWNDGDDIWRIKIWKLEDLTYHYRIIYAYERRKRCFHIFAVAPRSFNYERDHPITQRVLRAYYQLFH